MGIKDNHKSFYEVSTADIDAKMYRDILQREDRIEIISIVVFFVLICIFWGTISYWLDFGISKPKALSKNPISTDFEPIQENYEESNSFKYKSLINNYKVTLTPKAHYKLSGIMVDNNYQFIFPEKSNWFDSVVLYDLEVSWGELGKPDFYQKNFKSVNIKLDNKLRDLYTEYKTDDRLISEDYLRTHWSHTRIIPANKNILSALLTLKDYQPVEIEGELVDISYKNKTIKTSLCRTDFDIGDRGDGSAEILYAKSVKIGNNIYK